MHLEIAIVIKDVEVDFEKIVILSSPFMSYMIFLSTPPPPQFELSGGFALLNNKKTQFINR